MENPNKNDIDVIFNRLRSLPYNKVSNSHCINFQRILGNVIRKKKTKEIFLHIIHTHTK